MRSSPICDISINAALIGFLKPPLSHFSGECLRGFLVFASKEKDRPEGESSHEGGLAAVVALPMPSRRRVLLGSYVENCCCCWHCASSVRFGRLVGRFLWCQRQRANGRAEIKIRARRTTENIAIQQSCGKLFAAGSKGGRRAASRSISGAAGSDGLDTGGGGRCLLFFLFSSFPFLEPNI